MLSIFDALSKDQIFVLENCSSILILLLFLYKILVLFEEKKKKKKKIGIKDSNNNLLFLFLITVNCFVLFQEGRGNGGPASQRERHAQ